MLSVYRGFLYTSNCMDRYRIYKEQVIYIYTRNKLYIYKNEKHFKKRTKSRDAAVKKNRYKRSRDK